MPNWKPRAVLVLWLVSTAAFCFSLLSCSHNPAPHAPSNASARTLDPAAFAGTSHVSKLQVIITYDSVLCTHSALRLERPDRPTVFWDPGGSYGVNVTDSDLPPLAGDVRKTNDLILHQVPSIPAYWDFSYNDSDHAMEVFEWDVSDQRAEQIYKLLLAGAGINENQSDFHTETAGLFCSVALSDFLGRFPDAPFYVPGSYFFPHDLAEQLYTRRPDRVFVFRRDRPPVEYIGSQKEDAQSESKGHARLLQ